MSRSATDSHGGLGRALRLALGVALTLPLAACADSYDAYFSRRETIAISAGDALQANNAIQTIDPWSPASRDRSQVYNGQKMQSAAQRYREGKVIKPRGMTTSNYSGGGGGGDEGGAAGGAK